MSDSQSADGPNPTDVTDARTPEQPPEAPESPDASDRAKAPDVPIPADLAAKVEAALLTSDRALPAARLAEVLGGLPVKAINDTVSELNGIYETTGRSFRI